MSQNTPRAADNRPAHSGKLWLALAILVIGLGGIFAYKYFGPRDKHAITPSPALLGTSVIDNRVYLVVEDRAYDDSAVVAHPDPNIDPVFDPRTKVLHSRGYLVTAQLGKDQASLDASRRVVGPLYDAAGDARLSAANPKALKVTLTLPVFLDSTALLRSDRLGNDETEHLTLDIQDKSANWKSLGKSKTIVRKPFAERKRFESSTARFLVQQEDDGKAHLYDMSNNKEVPIDPWLADVSHDVFTNDERGGFESINLSDSLDHLAVVLEDENQVVKDGKKVAVKEFTLDNKQYAREDYGLLYELPSKEPRAFAVEKGFFDFPIFIDDQLRWFQLRESSIQLKDLDGKVIASHGIPAKFFPKESSVSIRWNRRLHQVVLIKEQLNYLKGPIEIGIWDFANDKFETYTLPIKDLFDESSDGYYPKKIIPVEAP